MITFRQEARFLFNSYVGAVCVQDGLQATTDWVSKLVKPDDHPPVLVDNSGSHSFMPPSHPPSQAGASHSAPPPYYPSAPHIPTSPSAVPLGTLALFNQTCSQRGISLEWNAVSNGASHDPRWEVKCLGERSWFHLDELRVMLVSVVDGVERGFGLGRKQKQAKELAAYEAYQYMQSIEWTCEFQTTHRSSCASLTINTSARAGSDSLDLVLVLLVFS